MVAGCLTGLAGFGGGKQLRGVDLSDGAAGVKGDGELGAGDRVRDFGDGEDVVGILGEEDVQEFASQGFDRREDSGQSIAGIIHEGMPGGACKTDLK